MFAGLNTQQISLYRLSLQLSLYGKPLTPAHCFFRTEMMATMLLRPQFQATRPQPPATRHQLPAMKHLALAMELPATMPRAMVVAGESK